MASEIERLLYREAHLLDTGRFLEWLELLAPDLRYWAPARSDVSRQQELKDEPQRLALFDETKATLTMRINRIDTGLAWAESPATRTRRFISNVIDEETAGGIVHVWSNFLLFKSRSFADETILVGCREDKWTRSGPLVLRERKILIDHCTVENMSLLL